MPRSISLVLSAAREAYVVVIGAYSGGDVDFWCEYFAEATGRAAAEAERMAAEIDERQDAWLERLGNPRSDAVVHQLIAELPAQPVIDVAAGRRLTGRSGEAVRNALMQLEEVSIVCPLNERRWGRAWECGELLELIKDFEESVRRPPGAT